MSSARSATIALATCLCAASPTASAQDGVLDRLAEQGVQIRKSFAGTEKEAGAPATVSYENPDGESNFYSADIAAKIRQIPWDDDWQDTSGRTNARLYPTFEFHRWRRPQQDQVKKSSVAATFELERGLASDSEASEDPFARMLFADAKLELTRDSIQHQTSRTLTMRVGIVDTIRRRWLGDDLVFGRQDGVSMVFLPTLAIEDYRKLAIKGRENGVNIVVADSVDLTDVALRLNLAIKPFRNLLGDRFVLTQTYSLRHNSTGGTPIPDTTRLYELSADYFLDTERRLAIGLSYQNGRDPARNFLDEEFSSIGFKLKLGKN